VVLTLTFEKAGTGTQNAAQRAAFWMRGREREGSKKQTSGGERR